MPETNLSIRYPSYVRALMSAFSIPQSGPEISDRIAAFEPQSLKRRPVNKQAVIDEFISLGNQQAASIVRRLPSQANGALDPGVIDRLLVTVHCEMQRLSEEFQHGRRVMELLQPILQALRESSVKPPLRVVDLGCGTGFAVRWLTAHASFDDDVELVGADLNSALIKEARRLAEKENLSCRFVAANAFTLTEPATVYLSTGVLHHFRGEELLQLFSLHNHPNTCAFLHFDFHQSVLAPFGSWLFHIVRMREPLAHDGMLSAVRAYTSHQLLSAARAGAPDFVSSVYGTSLWGLPLPRAFSSIVGLRPQYREAFIANMGNKVASLGVVE